MATRQYGSVRRLGPRYGRTVRAKLGKIEAEQKKKHKCPYCSAYRVKRVAVGIWECSKCGSKFTGRAYTATPDKKVAVVEEAAEE